MIPNWDIYRGTTAWTILHCINATRTNHYQTNQEIGNNLCSRRFSIVELVYRDINDKKEVVTTLDWAQVVT